MDEPTIDDPNFWDWFNNNRPPEFPVPLNADNNFAIEYDPGNNSATHVLPIAIEPIPIDFIFNR